MEASRSRAKRLLSYAGDAVLYLRLLPASARIVWALNRRPPGLTKPQWRALQRALAVDRAAWAFGDSLPGALLLAQDWRTRQAMGRLYEGTMTDPEDG